MWIKKYIEFEWLTFFSTPAILWQTTFVLIPLASLLCFSFLAHTDAAGWSISLVHYKAICISTYFGTIINSLAFAAITTLVCIIIAYPVAYFLAFVIKQYQLPLLLMLIVPSWTNVITQIYGWFLLLQKNGPLSLFLHQIHLTPEPMHLLNNKVVIIMGLVYCFLPFMILPIYLSLTSIERKLLEASADLGAGTSETFWRIIVPLSRSGLINGILLVCVPAFGEYAAIEVLGGSNYALWGGNIVHKFLVAADYSQGAALTVLGISALLTTLAFCIILYAIISAILSYSTRAPLKTPSKYSGL